MRDAAFWAPSRKFALVVLWCFLTLAPLAMAGPAVFSSINFPNATSTSAYAINPAGDIVGAYLDSSAKEHGFLLRAGNFTSIDYPTSLLAPVTWTEAWGITPQGDIVGQYGLADKTVHGFLLRAGNFYPIDVFGQPNTMVVTLSANGTIVGCYHQINASGGIIGSTMHGFVMDADGVTSYSYAPSMHNGVNPQGDITGFYTDGTGTHSYIIQQGVVSSFDFPGSSNTQARSISPTGDVVGLYKDSGGQFHGFLLRQGDFTSINADFAGASQTRAFGINPEGDIVGSYRDSTGTHGFLLTRRGGE